MAGIFIPGLGLIATIATIAEIRADNDQFAAGTVGQQWTPPEWQQPALTMMTVPASSQPQTGSTSNPGSGQSTYYVFDAVHRITHNEENRITENPIQTGANINPHAYSLPSRVQFEIGMSDVMASYTSQQWTGNVSKSVSAYQILLAIKEQKQLVTLTTRLKTYNSMAIESIQTVDTSETRYALNALVTFKKINLANVRVSNSAGSGGSDSVGPAQSARPQTTNTSQLGTVQPGVPSSSLLTQHQIPSSLFSGIPTVSNIPGAGMLSSNSLGQLLS